MWSVQVENGLHRRVQHTKLTFFSVGFKDDRRPWAYTREKQKRRGDFLKFERTARPIHILFTSFERGTTWQEK